MKTNSLINALANFFKISFWLMLVLLTINLGFELFTDKGELGKFSTSQHSSKGYNIPVNLSLTVFDSVVSHKNQKYENVSYYRKGQLNNKYSSQKLDSLKRLNTTIKNISCNEVAIVSSNRKEYFQLLNSKIESETSVKVKSTSTFLTALLFINAYSSFFLTILMFYFLKEIFKTLKESLDFHVDLSKKVKLLGLLLVLGVLFKLLLSYILFLNFDVIKFTSSINNTIILNPIDVLIRPRLNFKLGIFLLGISLIILGNLLKKGNAIQQENDLTI